MYMSLIRGRATLVGEVALAAWSPLKDIGTAHPAGQIVATATPDTLTFALTKAEIPGGCVLASYPCAVPEGPALLRIDEVCFPVGAIAHRHTHAGVGIRYLVRGSLRVEADDHTETMQVGDSWFEAAASPVRALAQHNAGVTSFLRAMVIPAAYAGKSTFALVNPADADLPRLQVTHRHIDLPF
jgi:quercetin dioxygenase-like cupin family protein